MKINRFFNIETEVYGVNLEALDNEIKQAPRILCGTVTEAQAHEIAQALNNNDMQTVTKTLGTYGIQSVIQTIQAGL